jgi:hypothetical protein
VVIIAACFLKGAPCLFMTIFSWKLAQVLRRASNRKDKLLASGMNANAVLSDQQVSKTGRSQSQQETDQKTRMLLAILLCYLASVLPFAIIVPTFLVLGREFQMYVFDPLFIIFDMIALTSNLTLFILLLLMSKLFRDTFMEMIWSKIRFSKKNNASNDTTRESSDQSKETHEESLSTG